MNPIPYMYLLPFFLSRPSLSFLASSFRQGVQMNDSSWGRVKDAFGCWINAHVLYVLTICVYMCVSQWPPQ